MTSEVLCDHHFNPGLHRIVNSINLSKNRAIIRLCLFLDRSTYCVCSFHVKNPHYCKNPTISNSIFLPHTTTCMLKSICWKEIVNDLKTFLTSNKFGYPKILCHYHYLISPKIVNTVQILSLSLS